MIQRVSWHERLGSVECFASLDDTLLGLLEQHMRVQSYASGAVICEEGEPGEWMFVVGAGEVAVINKVADGTRIQVATLHAGDYGGVMSLIEDEPRSATLEARGPVELWVLDHSVFRGLLETHSDLAMGMLKFMSRGLRRDSKNLATTLHYVDQGGLQSLYEECSPEERLVLDTINHKVAAAESLDAVMEFLFNSIRWVSPCDRLALAFLEEDANRLVMHWVRADYKPLLMTKGHVWDLQDSHVEIVVDTGVPHVINDLGRYLEAHPDSPDIELLFREGVRANITFPLAVEGRSIGVLFYSATTPDAYDDHHVRLHLAIADRLSQTVEKAYQIERLDAANKAYFEMLGFVSHELKSPLASTVMDGDVLLAGYLGELEPAHHQKVERMVKKCRYLLDMVGEYLNLAHLESGQFGAKLKPDVDFMAEVAEPSIDMVMPQIEEKGIRFERLIEGDAAPITCAPDLLQIVLVNLLSNAVKYGNEKGEVRLKVRGGPARLDVGVWNEGPGFPEDARSQLFRKFSRVQTPELLSRKGTGVGLYTTWRIIQAHHGKIDARSELGKWAEFNFQIPKHGPASKTPR